VRAAISGCLTETGQCTVTEGSKYFNLLPATTYD
jgi:hypothetical protein